MADSPADIPSDNRPPAPATAPLRVLVVDDHALVRSGVRSELTAHAPDLDVVAEADDVEGAIAAVHALRPDVVLLDVHLPGGNGGGGAEVVVSCHDVPETRFLALSVSDASDDVVAVIRAGARGYVTKAISTEDLAQAVRRVAAGDAAFSPRLAGFVLDAFGAGAGEVAVADSELDRLSVREREVMRLIARGYTYKECASELFISVKTVETHVSAVLRKLQLSNRNELTRWAMARRIV
ncbi:response regulator [Actinomyces sp. Marseille-P3109]|mgnify:FL=1|uniref:response regulator n=1 Tax=Actinomyces sp. Marseille-P3109 TaxID=2083009 RepID=UPI001900DFEF|nr:response regulator transcription factor [Actinomyces sp. Marseille-P3109]